MSAVRVSLVVAGLLCVTGCKKEEAAAPVEVAKTASPHAAMPQGGGATLVGTVAERLDAPNYTYLRLTGAGPEDVWAAVPTNTVAVGAKVSILNPMPMKDFESKTLARTFPVIMFGGGAEVVGADGQPTAAPAAPHPTAAPAELAPIKVEKAAGADAHTVAEVYAQRMALKGQTATVRGKVVKVTSGVLGRNWLHLRDGSGSEGTQDFDLIVTTTATAQVDDVVNVQGPVVVDKDLGSGYAYKVLIEDAKIVP